MLFGISDILLPSFHVVVFLSIYVGKGRISGQEYSGLF